MCMLPVSSDSKLVPAEGIRVGANGTFNSKNIVPWFLLINDLKSLCPVAEQLYSRKILLILHREQRDGPLACGIAVDGLLARSGTPLPLPEIWRQESLTVTGGTSLFVVWPVTVGTYILFFILTPLCALMMTPRTHLQQRRVPSIGGDSLRTGEAMSTFLEVA